MSTEVYLKYTFKVYLKYTSLKADYFFQVSTEAHLKDTYTSFH